MDGLVHRRSDNQEWDGSGKPDGPGRVHQVATAVCVFLGLEDLELPVRWHIR